MFFSILTTDDKYSLLNREKLRQPIHMQLSPKRKTFSQFVSAFFKPRLNFEQFQTNMTLIARVFSKLLNPKNVVKKISKKSIFRGPFRKLRKRGTKHC